jgi:hypothetical protein
MRELDQLIDECDPDSISGDEESCANFERSNYTVAVLAVNINEPRWRSFKLEVGILLVKILGTSAQ